MLIFFLAMLAKKQKESECCFCRHLNPEITPVMNEEKTRKYIDTPMKSMVPEFNSNIKMTQQKPFKAPGVKKFVAIEKEPTNEPQQIPIIKNQHV